MKVLGVWDGHDSGAAVVENGQVLCAINEERLTRRKLEVHFPKASIKKILASLNIAPTEIQTVAFSTSDPAKSLTRLFPSLKENYYQHRRRLKNPSFLSKLSRSAKYLLTSLPSNSLSKALSRSLISKQLLSLGIRPSTLHCIDHHFAHASAAAFTWNEESGAVITIDGVGDGLSGGVWEKKGAELTLLSKFKSGDSLGLLFEYATLLLNMRELEDEGVVMALAAYAHPVRWEKNPLRHIFAVEELCVRCKLSSRELFKELFRLHWRSSAENFAFLVQQTFESTVVELFRCVKRATGLDNVAYAGGAAANVRANMLIRENSGFKSLYVFPHMGDGGLALGSALAVSRPTKTQLNDLSKQLCGIKSENQPFNSESIIEILKDEPAVRYSEPEDLISITAELLNQGEIIFWFQAEMEYGPRALGRRSILARADSVSLRDQLNIKLKRRSWFAPFCPSMLQKEALLALTGFGLQSEPFMTSTYLVKEDYRSRLAGAMHIDGTCRPQVLGGQENEAFYRLLLRVRETSGFGALLNTSFNLHGQPLVCTPRDGLSTFLSSEARFLVFDRFLVERC